MHPQLSPSHPLAVRPLDSANAGVYSGRLNPAWLQDSLADDQGGVPGYWRVLKRRKWTIVLIAVLGMIAGFLVGVPQTPVYRAEGTLEIQDVNSDFMHQKEVNPIDGGDLSDIQTQVLILESDTLFQKVAKKINQTYKNTDSWWRTGGMRGEVYKILRQPPPEPLPLLNQAELRVRPEGPTRIVDITYDSPDPRLAADVVNTLATEYIDSNMQARWKMSQHTGEWLSRQLQGTREDLERSEAALQEYALRAGMIFTSGENDDSGNVQDAKLIQLQAELSKAQDDRVGVQSRFELTKSAPAETLPDIMNDDSLRTLRERLTDLRRQLADLTVVYTANDEKVKRVKAQIIPLENALERDRKDILDRIRNEYEAALRRENLLQTEYDRQSKLVMDQAQKSVQYNLLKREVDSNRQIYQAMLQQVKESAVASAMHASNVRVVDQAAAPFYPHSPNFGLNAMIGLFMGVLAGVAFVATREHSDGTLQQPGDAQFWLNVPELGTIRKATKNGSFLYAKTCLPRERYANDSLLERAAAKLRRKERVELTTGNRKTSPVAECFRAVRASILFTNQTGSERNVLVVSSANPGEGKTVVACNLAIALSEIQHRVLLIDGDLRKPRLHRVFDAANDRGLSTLLQATELTPELVAGIVRPTSVPNVSLLPSGPETFDAANQLCSPLLPALLERLKGDFDTVIVDSPPALEISDARMLGRLADAVVLVMRASFTTRESAIAVAHRFAEDRTNVLGVVLNDWDPKTSPRGYYGNRHDLVRRA